MKKVFIKPVMKDHKDVQNQTEKYEEPISERSFKIRPKQATLIHPATFQNRRMVKLIGLQ